jgi:GNAT superfamily N-acetyltransferase
VRKKTGLVQRLRHVSDVWEDFQETRDRDAVYDFLAAVFAIVQHYRRKGHTKKLIRRAFEFAELPLDKNADPFAAIIRCTCEEKLDRKTVSKWSRALRWAGRFKNRMPLKKFMKARGGINACASLYTECLGRKNR